MNRSADFVLRGFLVALCCATFASRDTSIVRADLTIISDDFTGGGDGAVTDGRAPNLANLPGGAWGKTAHDGILALRTTTTAGYSNPSGVGAYLTAQAGSGVSISSSGSYVKPTVFSIQADLKPNGQPGPASEGRGVALGFYSELNAIASFSQNYFTGLVLDSAGNLNLVHDPYPSGFFNAGPDVFRGTPIAFGGSFDVTAFYTLRYDINTVTGGISNITLGNSTADYSSFYSTSLFTNAATQFAGVYGSGKVADVALSAVDNFQVTTAVPEPSSAILVLGLVGSALAFRRRQALK